MLIFPLATSVKFILKLMKGIIESKALLGILIRNTIMPGKNEINVNGVKALWASLNVLDMLATAIHKPLIIME